MDKRSTKELVVPLAAFLVSAAIFACFAFFIDARVQAISPVAQWPLMGQVLHYLAPVLAVGLPMLVAFLLFAQDAVPFLEHFKLKNRRVKLSLIAFEMAVLSWVAWASIAMPVILVH